MKKLRAVLFFWIFFSPSGVFAGETPDLAGISLEEARRIQEKVVKDLEKKMGSPVGYKAGLTNPGIQKRLGLSHPLRGVLLKNMLLPGGSVLPADFGIRPACEGDLMVRVRDEAINEAATFQETLAALDAVIPFLEVPDLFYREGITLTAPMIAVINLGARYGIVGEVIPMNPGENWEERLGNVEVEIMDEKGEKMAQGKGPDLLGHPLNAVLWIRDSLKQEGKRLKKGDLLSLGSLTPMLPVKQGSFFRAVYKGLSPQGPVEVSVRFE